MNKGPQKKTTEKYVKYLIELMYNHKLNSYDAVVLKDDKLLKKYFPGNSTNINKACVDMIKGLSAMGIIEEASSSYIPHVKARSYNVNISRILKYLKDNPMKDQNYYNMLFPDFNPNKDIIWQYDEKNCVNIIAPQNSDGYKDSKYFNSNKVENLVWEIDPIMMNKKKFIKANYSWLEIDNARILIAENIRNNNPIFSECVKLCNEITKNTDNRPTIMLNIKLSDAEKQPTLSATCRQYNPICSWKAGTEDKPDKRDAYMAYKGYDLNFDLHSTIFAITRLLNIGEFDADWDLKQEILDDYNLASTFEKEELKNILNRCYFTKTAGQAWSQYNRNYWRYKKLTPVSEETFRNIYNEVQLEIGGSEPYVGNIFLYESLFELLVMKELMLKGIEFKNVYDCFFFKSEQTTEEEVKKIINEVAQNYNKYIAKL